MGRPERDLWPRMPKPQVAPWPAEMPRPLRILRFVAPGAGLMLSTLNSVAPTLASSAAAATSAASVSVQGSVVASAPAAVPHGGKGFGGGEATRDPAPTLVDPNDPKGKQQAIHKAESFAEYLSKRAAA